MAQRISAPGDKANGRGARGVGRDGVRGYATTPKHELAELLSQEYSVR